MTETRRIVAAFDAAYREFESFPVEDQVPALWAELSDHDIARLEATRYFRASAAAASAYETS